MHRNHSPHSHLFPPIYNACQYTCTHTSVHTHIRTHLWVYILSGTHKHQGALHGAYELLIHVTFVHACIFTQTQTIILYWRVHMEGYVIHKTLGCACDSTFYREVHRFTHHCGCTCMHACINTQYTLTIVP